MLRRLLCDGGQGPACGLAEVWHPCCRAQFCSTPAQCCLIGTWGTLLLTMLIPQPHSSQYKVGSIMLVLLMIFFSERPHISLQIALGENLAPGCCQPSLLRAATTSLTAEKKHSCSAQLPSLQAQKPLPESSELEHYIYTHIRYYFRASAELEHLYHLCSVTGAGAPENTNSPILTRMRLSSCLLPSF